MCVWMSEFLITMRRSFCVIFSVYKDCEKPLLFLAVWLQCPRADLCGVWKVYLSLAPGSSVGGRTCGCEGVKWYLDGIFIFLIVR